MTDMESREDRYSPAEFEHYKALEFRAKPSMHLHHCANLNCRTELVCCCPDHAAEVYCLRCQDIIMIITGQFLIHKEIKL